MLDTNNLSRHIAVLLNTEAARPDATEALDAWLFSNPDRPTYVRVNVHEPDRTRHFKITVEEIL